MAEADSGSDGRCKALTEAGERCSRPAQEDGFCFQHDERDQTVSETDSAQTDDGEAGAEAEAQEEAQEREQQSDADAETEGEVETTDPADVEIGEVDVEVDDERIEGLMAVRQTVEMTATDLVGYEFNSVSEIAATEDGWRATVDVVERRAVPDTQDILGRYEIELDEDGIVEGYRRIDRYRRGDTHAFE